MLPRYAAQTKRLATLHHTTRLADSQQPFFCPHTPRRMEATFGSLDWDANAGEIQCVVRGRSIHVRDADFTTEREK